MKKRLFTSVVSTVLISACIYITPAFASEIVSMDKSITYAVATTGSTYRIEGPTGFNNGSIIVNKPSTPTNNNPTYNPGNNPGNNQGNKYPAYNPGNNQGNKYPTYNPGNNKGQNKPSYNPGSNKGQNKPNYNPGNNKGNGIPSYNPGNNGGNKIPAYNPGNNKGNTTNPTANNPTKKHGPHWCYGACSLHYRHNKPRTEKHWCDGYDR